MQTVHLGGKMLVLAAFVALDSTLPLTSNHRLLGSVSILIFALVVVGLFPYFKKYQRRFRAYRRKHRASFITERGMYKELYEHDENELDSLNLQIKEKDLRIEILEKLAQKLEAEKNAYKSFAREIAFDIIPHITTPDLADRMIGTFQKFEGDSLNPIDLGEDLGNAIQEEKDRVIGDFFSSDKKKEND